MTFYNIRGIIRRVVSISSLNRGAATHLRKGKLVKPLAITGAAIYAAASVVIAVAYPVLYGDDRLLATMVALFQLINAGLAIVAIVLIQARQWTPLMVMMIITITYSILDVDWRLGREVQPSVMVVVVLLYAWQVFALAMAVKGRASQKGDAA